MTDSKHADTLNELDEMQRTLLYAGRRPVLSRAERIIVRQEQKIAELEAEIARLTAEAISVKIAGSTFLDDYASAVAWLREAWKDDYPNHATDETLCRAMEETASDLAVLNERIARLAFIRDEAVLHYERSGIPEWANYARGLHIALLVISGEYDGATEEAKP